jgi:hypothetical protein
MVLALQEGVAVLQARDAILESSVLVFQQYVTLVARMLHLLYLLFLLDQVVLGSLLPAL